MSLLPVGIGSSGDYEISRSVRLRSSASAYFNRTPGSVTNRRTMTFSFWMKRGLLTYSSNYITLFSAYPGTSAIDQIAFSPSSDSLRVWFNGSASADLITTQVFRDPSAWYHVVVAIDTTQATASNRIKVYVNGSQITSFSTATYPALNYDTYWNSSSYASAIGANLNGPQGYFDGYLTEVNFIDGQALTPSSFGETNAVTGVWKPKKYTGTYGTNGFYLNFSDNSAATAAAIGKDYSGNGNNWTPNNISVTAGVTYDSMLDVPTQWADGGNGRGNYATLNPVNPLSNGTEVDGNLKTTLSANGLGYPTIPFPTSGKWYAEITCTATTTYGIAIGLTSTPTASLGNADSNFYGYYNANGNKYVATVASAYGSSWFGARTDVIGIAFDADTYELTMYLNGVSQGLLATLPSGREWFLTGQHWSGSGSHIEYWNFGQQPFAYTPPTGFKALNTLNLPEPTILKGNQYFDAKTYSGTGGTQSITNASGFATDLAWIKMRSLTGENYIWDTVRGGGSALDLVTNRTNAEGFNSAYHNLAFTSTGFDITQISPGNEVNASGQTYIAWQWKEGATQGFDIVTYTGNGSAYPTGATVNHGLGVAPKMIIVKSRSVSSTNWSVYHSSLSSSSTLLLNTTGAAGSPSDAFNRTAPTSTVFSVGQTSGGSRTNENSATYVAYLFAEVSQFSKAFSFTGNGSTDGVFVFTGFLPRLILLKRTDTTGNWIMWDTARNTYNVLGEELYPNLSNAAASATDIDVLSNGFKLRNSTAAFNASGGTYIGFAWASNPFKYSLGF